MLLHLWGFCFCSTFSCTLLFVLSSHVDGEEGAVCFTLFFFLMSGIIVMWLFLMGGMQFVIVVFPDNTHLLF